MPDIKRVYIVNNVGNGNKVNKHPRPDNVFCIGV